MLNVLITGASGFVGQHLLEDLTQKEFSVSVITRSPEKKMRIIPDDLKVIKADLNDEVSLLNALKNIDVLINTAAEVRNANKLAETNINGTKNLIRAIVANKVSRVIHLSSVGVVGMQYNSEQTIINEQALCQPKNEYERTKLESEELLIEASREFGFSLVILRPTNVFGENHPYNALLNLIRHADSGKPLLGTSNAMVNYVYVKDLTAFIIKVLNSENISGIFNVGEAQKLSVFYSYLSACLNKKSKQITIPQFLVNFINGLGIKKLQAVSNRVEYSDQLLKEYFKYPFGLKKGIERTINWYREKGMIA